MTKDWQSRLATRVHFFMNVGQAHEMMDNKASSHTHDTTAVIEAIRYPSFIYLIHRSNRACHLECRIGLTGVEHVWHL